MHRLGCAIDLLSDPLLTRIWTRRVRPVGFGNSVEFELEALGHKYPIPRRDGG
jgi:hypothetical protein